MIDCSGHYGNHGCKGGNPTSAYRYIKDNNGIDTEKSYPYEARDNSCRYNPRNSGATDRGFVLIKRKDETQLKNAVATIGPIAILMDASRVSFQHYREGVYYDGGCNSDKLNHAVRHDEEHTEVIIITSSLL